MNFPGMCLLLRRTRFYARYSSLYLCHLLQCNLGLKFLNLFSNFNSLLFSRVKRDFCKLFRTFMSFSGKFKHFECFYQSEKLVFARKSAFKKKTKRANFLAPCESNSIGRFWYLWILPSYISTLRKYIFYCSEIVARIIICNHLEYFMIFYELYYEF